MDQLGRDNLNDLKRIYEAFAAKNPGAIPEEDDDDVPDLVENFDAEADEDVPELVES